MPARTLRSANALLSAIFVAALAGCTGLSQTPPDQAAKASDTGSREREVAPPSYRGNGQFQIPFGTSELTQEQQRAEFVRQSTTQGLIPTGRVYLGSIPCSTAACQVQRVTLTLLPDGRWRRVSQPLEPAGAARTETGCWAPEPGAQPLIHLLSRGQPQAPRLATLRMQSPAVLTVQALAGKTLPGRYTLNIQADTESITALQNDTSFYCGSGS